MIRRSLQISGVYIEAGQSLGIYFIFMGVPRCVTYFRGMTKCDRREGGLSKLVKNSVTYFMDAVIHTHAHAHKQAHIIYRVYL